MTDLSTDPEEMQNLTKEEGEVSSPEIISKMDSSMDSPSQRNYIPLLSPASDNSDASEKWNQSKASHVVFCFNGAECFKKDCTRQHPSDWCVCESGVNCKVLECKGTHPYKRKGPCRNGGKCRNDECQFLHPDPRLSTCPQGEEYPQWHYNKPRPKNRPNECYFEEKSILVRPPYLHPPDGNMCPDGAKYIKLPRHDLHLPNRLPHAQQLTPEKTSAAQNIFNNTAYFLMKSGNHENISLAQTEGVWSTTPDNENKLNEAFHKYQNVILFFSVNQSRAFQGFARMMSEVHHDSQPISWSGRTFHGVIRINWISRQWLNFTETVHLINRWNENKPVKVARDGQEIEPHCAKALCQLFLSSPTMNTSNNKNHYAINSIDHHRNYRSTVQSNKRQYGATVDHTPHRSPFTTSHIYRSSSNSSDDVPPTKRSKPSGSFEPFEINK